MDMGRWFRDIQVEIIAAGVLAAMTILIGKLQGVDPLLLAIATFAVLLIAFRVVYHLQEKRLKKRLNIEGERWNKTREERIRLRQSYSDRRIIPELLYKMGEIARELTEANPLEPVTTDNNEDMMGDFRELTQMKDTRGVRLDKTTDVKKLAANFRLLRKYKNPAHQTRALVLSLYQVLTVHGQGAKFLVENNERYLELDKQIEELLIGLPQTIHNKKDSYTQLANAYYTIAAIDFSKIELPRLVRLSQPFLQTAVVSELSAIRADISSTIERFLLGEDAK
jgi:hypothetical protein